MRLSSDKEHLQIKLSVTHSHQSLSTEASEDKKVSIMMLSATLTFCKIHECPLLRTKVAQG
jgi:hypothetical protein